MRFGPELQVQYCNIDALIPYARNARTHSEAQIAQIAASIVEFGWTNPILIDGAHGVIAGHGRLMAARKLGLKQVPVIELTHLSPIQKRAYILGDNRLALSAGWDDALLSLELAELEAADFDLSLTGFDADELADLLEDAAGGGDAGDEDQIPEPPLVVTSRPGDLWLLGEHRLLSGDATNAADVERLLDGARPHLLVSDPPYGVEYDPAWRMAAGVNRTSNRGAVANDHRADWREAWALFPGEVAYVWHSGIYASIVQESLEAAGFAIRAQIIWAKPRLVLSRGHYHWQHEPCWYAVRAGATGHWQGARDQTTVWPIAIQGDEDAPTRHGTQKPVECMLRPMLNNSAAGDAVYEPFSGSGTTLIAGQKSGRRVLAMELDPGYVDVAVERWERYSGGTAVLAEDGRSWQKVRAEREAGFATPA